MIEILLVIIAFQISFGLYLYWFYQSKKIHTDSVDSPVFEAIRKRAKAFASKPKKRKPVVNDDAAAFKIEHDL